MRIADSLFVLILVLKKINKKVARLCKLFLTFSLNKILLCAVLMIMKDYCERCTRDLKNEEKYLFFGSILCRACDDFVTQDKEYIATLTRITNQNKIFARKDLRLRNQQIRKAVKRFENHEYPPRKYVKST